MDVLTMDRKERPMARQEGKGKWCDNAKGYGFISIDGGKDVFVHFTDIIGDGYKSLEDGQEVMFEVGQSEKGPKAIKVHAV